MRPVTRTLIAFAVIVVGLFLLAGVTWGTVLYLGPLYALMFLGLSALSVGWMLYAYLRYRQARQDEILQVLATAIEAKLPLAPAIRAYLRDRPREGEGHIWDALLLVLFFPGDWLWIQRYGFDYKADELADLLGAGVPLPVALREVRGLAPREVRVAAAVGESTGRLATCLRRADSPRLAGAWLEIVPRLVYPLVLLLIILGITGFLMSFIAPKLQRIFGEFNRELPAVTQRLLDGWESFTDYAGLVAVAFPLVLLLAAVLVANPTARWHLPLFGRLYRWETQGLVLRMLGALLEADRPAPEAL